MGLLSGYRFPCSVYGLLLWCKSIINPSTLWRLTESNINWPSLSPWCYNFMCWWQGPYTQTDLTTTKQVDSYFWKQMQFVEKKLAISSNHILSKNLVMCHAGFFFGLLAPVWTKRRHLANSLLTNRGWKVAPCRHVGGRCLFPGARLAPVSSLPHVHVAHGLGLAPPPLRDYRPLCSDAMLIFLISENLLAPPTYVLVELSPGAALLKFSLSPRCLGRVAITSPSSWRRGV